MLDQLERLEALVEQVVARSRETDRENKSLRDEIEKMKTALQDKELELIRLRKENHRQREQFERETMSIKKDRSSIETKFSDMLTKLEGALKKEGPNN